MTANYTCDECGTPLEPFDDNGIHVVPGCKCRNEKEKTMTFQEAIQHLKKHGDEVQRKRRDGAVLLQVDGNGELQCNKQLSVDDIEAADWIVTE